MSVIQFTSCALRTKVIHWNIYRILSTCNSAHQFQTLNSTKRKEAFINVKKTYSSYGGSGPVPDPSNYTDYEVTALPEEWKFVERLMAPKYIPEPKTKEENPVVWIPPADPPPDDPYFVGRSRGHMVPVYLQTAFRGRRKITVISNIKGDIWALEKDLTSFLEMALKRTHGIKVDEVAGKIRVKGDYFTRINRWLLSKGY